MDPKPISVTYTDPGSYTGPAPQPFTIVGEEPGGGGGAVESVNTKTGAVVLSTGDLRVEGASQLSNGMDLNAVLDTLVLAAAASPALSDVVGTVSGATGATLLEILEGIVGRIEDLELAAG